MQLSLARHPFALLPVLALAGLLLCAPGVRAQVDPSWDHYKVYLTDDYPAPPNTQVLLQDRFGGGFYRVNWLRWFSNPAEKQLPPPGGTFPIHDASLHYSWWAISNAFFPPSSWSTIISITNQFGDLTLVIGGDPQFLLAPALKNQAGTPPLRNHYTCYQCDSRPTVTQGVTLVDQFDTWSGTTVHPAFFCTPVEKNVANTTYPIVDPRQCYMVYALDPDDPGVFTATETDQFVSGQLMTLHAANLLMVPTVLTGVTSNSSTTWGRLKRLYR